MEKRSKTKINGRMNICGQNITKFRRQIGKDFSQEKLAEKLQLLGLNAHKNMIQMIEAGKQSVTDIELVYFSKALGVSISDLMNQENQNITYEENTPGQGTKKVAQDFEKYDE